MTKYLLIFVLLFLLNLYSQISDSLLTSNNAIESDSLLKAEFQDSLSIGDSVLTVDKIIKADTLVPILEIPLSDASQIISRRTFLFNNYRYTGDFLRSFSFNFIKDLAFIGQPNENFVYGTGFGGISFLEDGILLNNRYSNRLDLNHVQSEDIDSVEIVSAPRGFLYGPLNNPVTVNLIIRDFIPPEPYSRIRYYEGPDGEAMIDGKFNAHIYRRWNFSFQLTNRGADNRYTNSEYSIWQINVRLKYFLSNLVNLIVMYNSVDVELGLNGGIDIDNISSTTTDINSLLYDNQLAPVLYPNRTQNILKHNFRLKLQTLMFDDAMLEFSSYYRYGEDDIKNDLDTVVVKNKYKNRNFGSMLRYDQQIGILAAQIFVNFDRNNMITHYDSVSQQIGKIAVDYLSAAGILSIKLYSGKFVPSFFYKYSHQNYTENNSNFANSNSGMGLDITIRPLENLSLYGGYSFYNQFEFDDEKSLEAGVKYAVNNLLFDIRYFDRSNFIPYELSAPHWKKTNTEITAQSIRGMGMMTNFNIWKILFEANFSYYFDIYGYNSFTLPEFQFVGGVYFKDKVFGDNLDLKAGVIFHYTGKTSAFNQDKVDPSQRVDISIIGEIKKVAIAYFIWENLLDNRYFITPYYPMPERNIRFGLSWELFN